MNGVEWFLERDRHGGFRFTTTLRLAYVEVSVPAGSYPNYADPLPDISTEIIKTIPDLSGRLGSADSPD